MRPEGLPCNECDGNRSEGVNQAIDLEGNGKTTTDATSRLWSVNSARNINVPSSSMRPKAVRRLMGVIVSAWKAKRAGTCGPARWGKWMLAAGGREE
jgi:hypothetical protein